ncbi:MAG TPA: Rieske 2Fe-2S domain-containing protein [Dehalococcoidia bacterium]|nr:Rieske 2Fe-2S domain-containing protein [Dehalococcoidia bacterium]
MLSAQDNETLCRVGPGTMMGELMRQYWVPVLLSTELPSPDSAPMRLRLLGEDLIAFRVTSGNPGIVVNACPHRGASLFFGRNEEEGLRCVYHGWKFDVDGNCVDMPSEPSESNFKSKVRVRAYPCQERNGIIWTYMGPLATPPPLPELEANLVPENESSIRKRVQESNYMQALEGDIDTIHAGFLHYGHVPIENTTPGSCYYYTLREKTAKFVVADNEIGATYGAYRTAEADTDYWRIAHFLFPFYTMNPSDLLGQRIAVFAWVPIDDENTMTWAIQVTGNRDPNGTGIGGLVRGAQSLRGPLSASEILPPSPAGMLPDTSGWNGRFRPRYNIGNDFLIDRQVQAAMATYSGVPADGQDPMAQVSMGTIYDRTHEHLGVTDAMIIRSRRRLLDAAKALAQNGTVPPGVEDPSLYRIRSGGAVLPKGVDGLAVTQDAIHGRSMTVEIPIAVQR